MTKDEVCKKFTGAAMAESHGNGKYGRADNFGPTEFRFRQKCYTSAEFTEVGHNLIEVEFDVDVAGGKPGEVKTINQVWYVQ